MKVLLDECLPRYLKQALVGHDVKTVQEVGWSGQKNGELLRLAQGSYEAFLTADQNLRYQQNLADRTIAIIELPTNRLPIIRLLVAEILSTLDAISPGEYVRLKLPSSDS